MNTDKLTRIKAALRLTVELAEKATPRPWKVGIRGCEYHIETDAFGWLTTDLGNSEGTHDDAHYIAHACNMGAPMAKALLVAIDAYESMLKSNILDLVDKTSYCLTSIINSFPDEV